jgi:hypothetical protein
MNVNSKHSVSTAKRAAFVLLAALMMMTSMASRAEILPDLFPTELAMRRVLDGGLLQDEALAPEIPFRPLYAQSLEVSNHRGARYPDALSRAISVCEDCEVQLGVGGTYHSFGATGGTVIPLTVSWNRSRWEFGVFHFSEQTSSDNDENVERIVARPYWGASLSRRFQFFERGPLRAIFGFGLSYRTEQDILSATHWNFSSQFGLRFQSPQFPAIFELSARHWSNGGVRTPNRGQDFTILTVRFDR